MLRFWQVFERRKIVCNDEIREEQEADCADFVQFIHGWLDGETDDEVREAPEAKPDRTFNIWNGVLPGAETGACVGKKVCKCNKNTDGPTTDQLQGEGE
jgi:hypothetical protein